MNNEHKDHKISLPNFDFERMSHISEIDLEEDIDESDLPSKMQRLLAMEDVDTSFCPSLKTKALQLPLLCLYKES